MKCFILNSKNFVIVLFRVKKFFSKDITVNLGIPHTVDSSVNIFQDTFRTFQNMGGTGTTYRELFSQKKTLLFNFNNKNVNDLVLMSFMLALNRFHVLFWYEFEQANAYWIVKTTQSYKLKTGNQPINAKCPLKGHTTGLFKGYLRYIKITSRNVPSKAQVNNFFVS